MEVLPECWPAVELFVALSTQWRRAGMNGVPTGIDYAAIPATASMLRRKVGPQLFEDLRVMEAAALEAFAERERRGH